MSVRRHPKTAAVVVAAVLALAGVLVAVNLGPSAPATHPAVTATTRPPAQRQRSTEPRPPSLAQPWQPAVEAGLPSRGTQIKVLRAALARLHGNAVDSPGPADVTDYGVGSLWLRGIDGAGTTVAVVEGWDDPAIGKILQGFDQQFGLPAPPALETVYPTGLHRLPSQCPPGMVALGSFGSCAGWRSELELDVISAHLMAPYARILIVVAPPDSEATEDAASNVAPPEMMEALEAIAAGHLANVVSISDGSAESSYSHGAEEITAQDPGELAAAAAGIPFLVATGDTGVVQTLPSYNGDEVTSGADTGTWDDSPWATAVGGTTPNLTKSGAKAGPDPLWRHGYQASSSAGYSSVFSRPAYQDGVAAITGSAMRSVPDISLDARSGTSEAAPLLAGILALATQLNDGENVGPVNPLLYQVLGPAGARDGNEDVVSGNDSYYSTKGKLLVRGFDAKPGFDVASGWGTLYAPSFVPALVTALHTTTITEQARRQAAGELAGLETALSLSPAEVPATGRVAVVGRGMLPGQPAELLVDGRPLARLTVGALGTVTYTIDLSKLSIGPGAHTVAIDSMLLEESARFTVS